MRAQILRPSPKAIAMLACATLLVGCASAGTSQRNDGTDVAVASSSLDTRGASVVTLVAPVHDSRLKGLVVLTAETAQDPSVEQVRWLVDGTEISVDQQGPPWSATWDTTSVSDGPHVILAKVADASGIWGTSQAVGIWVDNDELTNVVDTAVTRGPRASNTATPTFEFESQMPQALFECRLDGLAALPCSSPLTLPNLKDGAHTLVVTALTPSGQADPSPAEVPFIIDTTPPTVELTDPVSAQIITGTVPMAAHAIDASGVTALRWYIDGSDVAYDADGEPWTRPWDSTTIPDGRHRIFVKARDAAGNWGTSISVDVTVANAGITTSTA